MNAADFDIEALFRAVIIGIIGGLIVASVGYFAMRDRKDWSRKKPVIGMIGLAIGLFLVLFLYYSFPTLPEVPSLDGLSQAEAENVLAEQGLVAQPRPQQGANVVEPGRVIPNSQSPGKGLRVRRGTVVSFGVAIGAGTIDPLDSSSGTVVSLLQPRSQDKGRCSRGADGIYRLSVSGTSSGIRTGEMVLLLWIRIVSPPSDVSGWYLQRPPGNGIARIESDGSWTGTAQIGNAQWSPHEGNILDLAVTLVDAPTAQRLIAEPGVVVRDQPIGTRGDTALGVVVTLK